MFCLPSCSGVADSIMYLCFCVVCNRMKKNKKQNKTKQNKTNKILVRILMFARNQRNQFRLICREREIRQRQTTTQQTITESKTKPSLMMKANEQNECEFRQDVRQSIADEEEYVLRFDEMTHCINGKHVISMPIERP
jgi:hypothetical protein